MQHRHCVIVECRCNVVQATSKQKVFIIADDQSEKDQTGKCQTSAWSEIKKNKKIYLQIFSTKTN